MAVVKYRGKESALTLSENEFMQMMMERAGSKQWQEILYIQNYIVTPGAMAEPLIYKYTAPADSDNPGGEIRYSIRKFEEDDILKRNDIYRYAQKLCTIVGYYLSRVYSAVMRTVRRASRKYCT